MQGCSSPVAYKSRHTNKRLRRVKTGDQDPLETFQMADSSWQEME
jgi:hypothetical protein